MAALTAGVIVIVRFPFSDLTNSKVRPALVLANAGRGDWILCQITSKAYADESAIEIRSTDFSSGNLNQTSYARPGKLFTANESLILLEACVLSNERFSEIAQAVIRLFQSSL